MSLLDSYAKSAAFPTLGTQFEGRVVQDAVEIQQKDFDSGDLLFWEDGNPRMQLVVTIDTGKPDPTDPDDDGERAVYLKGQALSELKKKLRPAKAKWVHEGDWLSVTWTDEEPLPRGKRGKPKKIYEVRYERGANHSDRAAEKAETDSAERAAKAPAPKAVDFSRLATQHERNDAARDRAARDAAQDEEPPF